MCRSSFELLYRCLRPPELSSVTLLQLRVVQHFCVAGGRLLPCTLLRHQVEVSKHQMTFLLIFSEVRKRKFALNQSTYLQT